MHPTLWKIGSLEIHSYGLMLAIAFLVSIQLFISRGRRRGLVEGPLNTLSLWVLVLGIVGGRALFVLTHWEEYAADPSSILRLWEGGLMLYGGYVLGIAGGILYARRAGIPIWRMTDAAAPSMALGIGIGRLGCFLNGCCFGLPTHLPWGIHFPEGSYSGIVFPGEAIHPSQLYLAAAGIGLFVLLLAIDRRPGFDGRLFWLYVALDAGLRFVIDFTRYYDSTSFLGRIGSFSFNINQILSGALIVTALLMLAFLRRSSLGLAGTETLATGPASGDAHADSERPDASEGGGGTPEPSPPNSPH